MPIAHQWATVKSFRFFLLRLENLQGVSQLYISHKRVRKL